MEDLGFIIIRHVCSGLTNMYWMQSYTCIRKFYPNNRILIIDDDSDNSFLTIGPLEKSIVIQSEYPRCGEILGYYYFWKTRMFKQAIIIHDSVFFQKHITFPQDSIRFMWHFDHHWDLEEKEELMLKQLNNNATLLELHANTNKWKGCFGTQSVISLEFLDLLVEKYNLFCLLPLIHTRESRQIMERVFAVLCTKESPDLLEKPSFLGNIHGYGLEWGTPFYAFLEGKLDPLLPLIKVWTGR